jgi:hypothetical protein
VARCRGLRKKKTSVEAAYDEVLESVKQDQPQAVLVANSEAEEPDAPAADDEAQDAHGAPAHSDNGNAPAQTKPEEVRLHRPLIRAQLPRIEREPAARPAPEFTIRQANKRQGRFQNNNSRPGRFAKSGGQGGQGGNSRGPSGGQGGTSRRRPSTGARRADAASRRDVLHTDMRVRASGRDRPFTVHGLPFSG